MKILVEIPAVGGTIPKEMNIWLEENVGRWPEFWTVIGRRGRWEFTFYGEKIAEQSATLFLLRWA